MKITLMTVIRLNMFVGLAGFVYMATTGYLLDRTGFFVGMGFGAWGGLFTALYIVWTFRKKL